MRGAYGWLAIGLMACGPSSGDDASADGPVGPGDGVAPGDGVTDDTGVPTALPPLYPRHRLNREEYRASVRDLLGVQTSLVDDFPADPESSGFKSVAHVLGVSPLQVEKWAAAAQDLAALAVADRLAPPHDAHRVYEAELAGFRRGFRTPSFFVVPLGNDLWVMTHPARDGVGIEVPEPGTYTIRVQACRTGDALDDRSLTLEVDLGGEVKASAAVLQPCEEPQDIRFTDTLRRGRHVVGLTPVGTVAPDAQPGDVEALERAVVAVDYVEVIGPIRHDDDPGPVAAALSDCDPDTDGVATCAEALLAPLAARAYRRPLMDEDLAPLVATVEQAVSEGLPYQDGVRYALRALLTSPHFLFRLELHPDRIDPADDPTPVSPHPWEAFEVAGRLSLALWRRPPDESLWDCAADGSLLTATDGPCALSAQVGRMLDDPRSDALVEGFLYEWLGLDLLDAILKTWEQYPTFDQEVAHMMQHEIEATFLEFVRGDLPFDDMMTRRTTWLNDALADYYDLPLPGSGADFVPYPLPPGRRGGLLQTGGVLTLTSLEQRTSPSLRAVWMLQTLLCTQVGSPPPGAGSFEDDQFDTTAADLLDAHSDPACRSCHDILDPLGLALENYDAVGLWRDAALDGTPIVVHGQMPDGRWVRNPHELGQVVQEDPAFRSCLVRKVATALTGRELSSAYGLEVAAFEDEIDALVTAAEASPFTFRDVVKTVVTSELFTHVGGR